MNKLKYIITKTPLRVSFFGGGTDISYFYKKYNGAVISSTINRFVYITVKSYDKLFREKYRLNYSQTEHVKKNIKDIKNNIIKECLNFLKIKESLNICISTDIPASSGLGTSSAIIVGLLKALYAYKGIKVKKSRLAEDACSIEINLLKNPIGKQDQYNAVYGGFKAYKFLKNDKVLLKSLNNRLIKKVFLRSLFLWVGNFKESKKVLTFQKNVFNIKQKYYLELLSVVNTFNKLKYKNYFNIRKFGELLEESWTIKKKMSQKISNSNIDRLYTFAKKNGAIGGKLLGAGSGGFLFLVFPKLNKKKILKIFKNKEIYFFNYHHKGSEIIYKKNYK
jgi:D-glycero-alpha-D-manno-heptose-7-phosphate kinase